LRLRNQIFAASAKLLWLNQTTEAHQASGIDKPHWAIGQTGLMQRTTAHSRYGATHTLKNNRNDKKTGLTPKANSAAELA